ncbi:MAG: 3-phosphoshikimate 1-carboxyvinyltransferase, partial [Firmicutes bacterium]|nr:3-phosphoshikimate 1-carboxyvinyltransferase [Bacillota bacterium]
LREHGMKVIEERELLYCGGRLKAGKYAVPGNISSQYISGLLMSLPFADGNSTLEVTGRVESSAYITMTEDVLKASGIRFDKQDNKYGIPGGQTAHLPAETSAEGDYSNAAFFLCMGALSPEGVKVRGLKAESSQGDRAVLDILRRFGADVRAEDDSVTVRRGGLRGIEIDASQVPDLIPVLSVLSVFAEGETRVINAARLRIKESDRLESTAALIRALGGNVTVPEDGLVIPGPQQLSGGTADSAGDHRIAMSAAVAACGCAGAVDVQGSECVSKSYPRFWDDLAQLKGGC